MVTFYSMPGGTTTGDFLLMFVSLPRRMNKWVPLSTGYGVLGRATTHVGTQKRANVHIGRDTVQRRIGFFPLTYILFILLSKKSWNGNGTFRQI